MFVTAEKLILNPDEGLSAGHAKHSCDFVNKGSVSKNLGLDVVWSFRGGFGCSVAFPGYFLPFGII